MRGAFRVSAFALMVMSSMAALAQPPLSAADKLKACEKRYAEMKTYQDSGEVKIDFKASRPFSDTRPFKTAFQREGGFHWQFESSASPGRRPDLRYVVWSVDQESFQSWWTIGDGVEQHANIAEAMGGPTGVSGGSATAIVPLLFSDMQQWGGRLTSLEDPADKPAEKVDDVECSVITGTDARGGSVTLWLDPSLVIRRIVSVQEIDPAKVDGAGRIGKGNAEKFTTITTITIKPIIDAEIPAERFVEKAANVPAQNK